MEDFEKVLKHHERIIFHLIHKYGIRDEDGEFYQLGLIALWQAWREYDSSKSKFSSYAYLCVRRELLHLIDHNRRVQEKHEKWLNTVRIEDLMVEDLAHELDPQLLHKIQNALTMKQWKWFEHCLLHGYPLKEFAQKEAETYGAVKNCGKRARAKLRMLLTEEGYAL
ncbi:sigma-70 family RNA polymerase sigma factor [Gracilibacillus dipsosauri]|uniref:sigma-70 family RNA polymerase sigma factor n=1 Tax=Gracilibacillus dipsosauri TaxID=178340 RepID=UPI00240A2A04